MLASGPPARAKIGVQATNTRAPASTARGTVYCPFAPATIATTVNSAVPPTSTARPNFVKAEWLLFVIFAMS